MSSGIAKTELSNGKYEEPLLSFGVITDIQYADIPDGSNYSKTRRRYYRNSLNQLKRAVSAWNQSEVSFVLQLGDVVDGYNKRHKISETSLATVMEEFNKFHRESHHIMGNHDMYNFSRQYILRSQLNSGQINGHIPNGKEILYYDFSPHPSLRVVMLDLYEIGMLGRIESDPVYQNSKAFLRRYNFNNDLNDPTGLEGLNARFLQYNGEASQEQLDWFDSVLSDSQEKKQTVIVAGI